MWRSEPDMGNTRPRINVPGEAGFNRSVMRHAGTCDYCRNGGHPSNCDGYQALLRDIERANRRLDPDRIKTAPEGVMTMRQMVDGDELDAELAQHAEAGKPR